MLTTLMDLRSVIGKNIDDLQRNDMSDYERNIVVQRSQETANLAKQFNNIAKIVLNADQMSGRTDRIDEIIGCHNAAIDKAVEVIGK